MDMEHAIDLQNYPLHISGNTRLRELVDLCRAELERDGMFNLKAFVKRDAVENCVATLRPRFAADAFTHRRRHNIYFEPHIEGLPADHPALREVETVNHTLCGDQLADTVLTALYEWQPFIDFLAEVMGKPALFTMDDPLARVNAMAYEDGEALNWHFDRSEFTVTLLLQAPERGGEFQYRSDLRTDNDPNYEGVAGLLEGRDETVRTLALSPGTLNVFKGLNTPHRVSPVGGERQRMIAVFSYYERPGVMFSEEERIGFYGRAG